MLLYTPIRRSADSPVAALEQAEQVTPQSFGEVADTVMVTLLQVWTDFIAHAPYMAFAVLVLLLTWGLSHLLNATSHRLFKNVRLRDSLKELLNHLMLVGVWVTGLLLAAMVLFPGLTPANAIGALGLASVAIGLAFKDIFENLFAGILLLWRFPFENGDFIECEDIMGRVESTTIRMTKIRKPSGELVVVPNAFLFKNPVEILTNLPKRRISIVTGVAYGENVQEAVTVIQTSLKACKTVFQEREVEVFPQGFGASSIDIEVAWWVDPEPLSVRKSRGEVVTTIKQALDDAGIEIPFPYRTLTFKEPTKILMTEPSNQE